MLVRVARKGCGEEGGVELGHRNQIVHHRVLSCVSMGVPKEGVFISHITEEAPIADAVKVYLKRCFGHTLSVFVSSDYDSIETGEEWYRAIVESLLRAKVVIALLSKYSIDRRWINFEAGITVGAKHRLLPVTIRGFQPESVGWPLGQLHVRTLLNELTLESLVAAIAEAIGQQEYTLENGSQFIQTLQEIEATLPMKGIALEPLLQRQQGNDLLRLRLSNTGNRDVELIEIEVAIPKPIIEPNWHPQSLANGLTIEWRKLAAVDYLIMWESPYEGSLDTRFGRHRFLPRVVSPHWTPRLSDVIKVPLRNDLGSLEQWQIKFKVVARDVYSEEQSTSLAQIPYLD